MQLNYIILAHTKPQQVARMMERLITRDTRFYIHIDKDVDSSPFKKELGHFSNTYFMTGDQRVSGLWADWGIVQATLHCIKQIVADDRKGYCVLISGQDYPIKSNAYIQEFFSSQYGINFIQGDPLFSIPGDELCSRRINRYKINLSNKRGDYLVFPSIYDREFYQKFNWRCFVTLAKRRGIGSCLAVLPKTFRKRRFPAYIQPYKGSPWWALPVETLHYILDFIQQHPGYLAYHQYTFAPDEIFLHSIIISIYPKARIRDDLTYTKWTYHSNSPVILRETNFDELINDNCDKLFARKFDAAVDSRILDLIDSAQL